MADYLLTSGIAAAVTSGVDRDIIDAVDDAVVSMSSGAVPTPSSSPVAMVHIGPFKDSRENIIVDYYNYCRLETIDVNPRIETGEIRRYRTLEELIGAIAASPQDTHIIVNHGDVDSGLIVPFTRETSVNSTGREAGSLANLARLPGPLTETSYGVVVSAQQMAVKPKVALRLIDAVKSLLDRPRVIHLRGCNMGGNLDLLERYKRLFNAQKITAPSVRMFYLRVDPKMLGNKTIEVRATEALGEKTRRRLFTPPSSEQGPLLLEVKDLDGHSDVTNDSYLADLMKTIPWAKTLTGRWTRDRGSFVLPVLWSGNSFYCPLEGDYQRLLFWYP